MQAHSADVWGEKNPSTSVHRSSYASHVFSWVHSFILLAAYLLAKGPFMWDHMAATLLNQRGSTASLTLTHTLIFVHHSRNFALSLE